MLTVAGHEPIVPFDIEVSGEGFRVRRSMLVPGFDGQSMLEIPRATLERFGARGFRIGTGEMLAAAGISDPKQNRIERLQHLEHDLEQETDPLAQAALRKRISELTRAIANPTDERIVAMQAIEEFTFELTGPSEIEGKASDLLELDRTAPWLADFWMGCWDADALCGYVKGSLRVAIATKQE